MIHIWNLQTGQELNQLRGHQSKVTRVLFSHAGDLLASSGWDSTVRLWDPIAGKELLQHECETVLQFRADDRQLAFLDGRELSVCEVADRECRTLWGVPSSDHPIDLLGSDFSPDGRLWACASSDGVRLWDVAAKREVAALRLGKSCSVVFLPDGRGMFTSSHSGIRFWPLALHQQGAALRIGPPGTLIRANPVGDRRVALSADGQCLAAITDVDQISVLNRNRPGEVVLLRGANRFNSIAVSADGRWVACATWGGEPGTRVWDAHTGQLLRVLLPDVGGNMVGFSPDGRWAAARACFLPGAQMEHGSPLACMARHRIGVCWCSMWPAAGWYKPPPAQP